MQDPEFAEAYVEMQSEMNVIRAMIDASGIVQKQVTLGDLYLIKMLFRRIPTYSLHHIMK